MQSSNIKLKSVKILGTVQVPADKFVNPDDGAADLSTEKKQIILNSAEELFAEIR